MNTGATDSWDNEPSERAGLGLKTLGKMVDVLDTIACGPPSTINELVGKVGMHRSTVYRILSTLQTLGMVERIESGNRFRLGPRMMELGWAALRQHVLIDVAQPILESLSREVQATIYLGVFDRDEVLYTYVIDSPHRVAVQGRPGMRAPAHCTAAGKVFLSAMGPARLRQVLSSGLEQLSEATITDPQALTAQLREVRRQGYAICDQEYESGVRSVAVPIYGMGGEIRASLTLSDIADRLPGSQLPTLAGIAREYALKLSRLMGGNPLF